MWKVFINEHGVVCASFAKQTHADEAKVRVSRERLDIYELSGRSTDTAMEALELMRDTTNSQEVHDRAVEALKFFRES